MVKVHRTSWVGATASLATVIALAGCDSLGPVVEYRPDPLVYVVLNQRVAALGRDPDQRAFLLTLGSPAVSEYRVAQRFEMRAVRDGSRFVWQDLGRRGLASVDGYGTDLGFANYALKDGATAPDRGALDLVSGEEYTLHLDTDGVAIGGQVRIPAAFELTILDGPPRVVMWKQVSGAAMYNVTILGATAGWYQADTVVVMPALKAGGADIVVNAIDPNLWRFISDSTAARSGIDAGYGVFGAISTARLHVDP